MHSKMYILVKDSVSVGYAVNSAAHASLMCYLKFKNHPNMKEWLKNSFRKVSIKVSGKVFNKAKKFKNRVVFIENDLNNKEVAIAFLPRKKWPKFFSHLQLYK